MAVRMHTKGRVTSRGACDTQVEKQTQKKHGSQAGMNPISVLPGEGGHMLVIAACVAYDD